MTARMDQGVLHTPSAVAAGAGAMRFVLHFVSLRKCGEQRLRFLDLRKFRRRRKAFERGREHGMGVGGAIGRLIELRQRERRAQLVAPRLLLLRNGDGGEERFLGRRRVRRIALEQDFAADAMGFRCKPALSVALGLGHGVVDGERARRRSPRPHSASAKRGGKDRHIESDPSLAARLDCRAHLRETGVAVG